MAELLTEALNNYHILLTPGSPTKHHAVAWLAIVIYRSFTEELRAILGKRLERVLERIASTLRMSSKRIQNAFFISFVLNSTVAEALVVQRFIVCYFST